LDLLWTQTETDGGMPYRTIGTAKVELIQLEQQLRDHDSAESGKAVSDIARDLLVAPLAVQLAAVVQSDMRALPGLGSTHRCLNRRES
jgi:hypothetical protein